MPFNTEYTRRQTLAVAAALTAAAALPGQALAQSARVPVADLMAPQALPDVWIGKADAPVSIIEYASLTCSHCAAFHATTYKELKAKYIDAGKVRLTVREFPFDALAMAGFMLARCQDSDDKRQAMVDLLFDKQTAWVNDKPLEGLTSLTRQAGMSEDTFKKCLDNKELYEKIGQVRDYGTKKFNVNSTPTFFVNGVLVAGNQPLAEFEKAMAEFLK